MYNPGGVPIHCDVLQKSWYIFHLNLMVKETRNAKSGNTRISRVCPNPLNEFVVTLRSVTMTYKLLFRLFIYLIDYSLFSPSIRGLVYFIYLILYHGI